MRSSTEHALDARTRFLVTGSTGLLGSSLKQIVGNDPAWVFVSRKDADLRSLSQTKSMLEKYSPTHVVHLAANVGGVFKNMSSNGIMMYENTVINFNVIESCRLLGIKNVIGILSSCIFPDGKDIDSNILLLYETLNSGVPHESNYGYAYSKRMMHVLGKAYNNDYGMNYISLASVNMYGNLTPTEMTCSIDSLHVIPALVRKFCSGNNSCVNIEGDGTPLRQFVHSTDVASILVSIVNGEREWEDLFVSPGNEVSIREVAELVSFNTGITYKFNMRSKNNGQLKKYVPKSPLDYTFRSIEDGVSELINQFNLSLN